MRSLDRMGDWKLYAVASLGIVATTVAMIRFGIFDRPGETYAQNQKRAMGERG